MAQQTREKVLNLLKRFESSKLTFGNFAIPEVPAGSTYVLSIAAKGYTFTPQTLMVNDDLAKLDLVLDQ